MRASDSDVCAGTPVVLSYEGGIGNEFEWYENGCEGEPIGTGNNVEVIPSVTTTYYGKWKSGSCESSCKSVEVIVTPVVTKPNSVRSTDTLVCMGESSVLFYNEGHGDEFAWYTESCDGVLVGSGNFLEVVPSETTTYFGRWESACVISSCEPLTIYVDNSNEKPVEPTNIYADNNNICHGSSTILKFSGGSGREFKWYDDSSLENLIGTGNDVEVSPTRNTTYFGRWETECGESAYKSIQIFVTENVQPADLLKSSKSEICGGEKVTLMCSGGNGDTFAWYISSCGTELIGKGEELTVTPNETTTYFGRWENDCGASECRAITIKVNPLPVKADSVSVSESEICAGTSTQLNVFGGSGNSFAWYSNQSSGETIGIGNSLIVSPTKDTKYFGRWENTCGTTDFKIVEVRIKPTVTPPSLARSERSTICLGESIGIGFLGGSGEIFNWYTGSCNGDYIGTGNNFVVSPTETSTYYGRWENSCENSDCVNLTIEVNSAPDQPTFINADENICEGEQKLYSVNKEDNVSYNWEIPESWIGSSESEQISIKAGSLGGVVSVTPSNLCGNGDANSINVTIGKNTVIDSQPEDIFCKVGDNIALEVIAEGQSLAYQWRFNNNDIMGANSPNHYINEITENDFGEYTVQVRGDCGEQISDIIRIDRTTSIEESNIVITDIYPNPSTGRFMVESSIEAPIYKLEIFDSKGKQVFYEFYNQKLKEIDISNAAKGVYYLKFEAGGVIEITKLILE